MGQLSIRPQICATLNFILITDPPPSLQRSAAIVDCLCKMMDIEDLRGRLQVTHEVTSCKRGKLKGD